MVDSKEQTHFPSSLTQILDFGIWQIASKLFVMTKNNDVPLKAVRKGKLNRISVTIKSNTLTENLN